MSSYRLAWRSPVVGPVDGAILRPDYLARLSPEDLPRQRLLCGRVWRELGELFSIRRVSNLDAPRLELEGSDQFVRLAAGMAEGELHVEGEAGVLAAAGLRGGRVNMEGNAGDWAGAAMSGGQLFVRGSVGDHLGGPLPGTLSGMQGGEIVVLGSAGAEAGLRQRRGLIAIAGAAGCYAGHHMRAGTIVIGEEAPWPGIGMQRGTILCRASQVTIPPSFRRDGPSWPGFWTLLRRRLVELGYGVEKFGADQGFISYSGDCLSLGRGEILCAE
jgi:formylmethanofuran dehydrogenase subunit C